MNSMQKQSTGPARLGEDVIDRAHFRTRVEHAGTKDGVWILKLRGISETFEFSPDRHPAFYANDPVIVSIEKVEK